MEKTEANIRFGKRVSELRIAKCLTQEHLAFMCGFDRTYIGCIERGEKSPTLNTIDKLAKGLGVSLKELFSYDT